MKWATGFIRMSLIAGVLLAGCGSDSAEVDLTMASVANGGLLTTNGGRYPS